MRWFPVLGMLCISVLIALSGRSAKAQDDPNFEVGMKPYGTYHGGDIDTIDLSNGSLAVDIPLISYPQRGKKLNLDFELHYENKGNYLDIYCWSDDYGDGGCYYVGPSELLHGFSIIQKDAPKGIVEESLSEEVNSELYFEQFGYVVMSDGPVHSLVPTTSITNWESNDATAYQANIPAGYGNNPVTLIGPDGVRYSSTYFTIPGPSRPVDPDWPDFPAVPALIEDTNGNQISYSGAAWTDTMGRTFSGPELTNLSDCPQAPQVPTSAWIWNLPGPNGGTYPILFCSITVSETLEQQNPNDSNDASLAAVTYNATELQSVVLPNHTAWTFTYFPTTGDLQQITFPTGGTLAYGWVQGPQLMYTHVYLNVRSVATRTLNPNDGVSSPAVSSYSYSFNTTNTTETTTLTDGNGNDSVHTFGGMAPANLVFFQTQELDYQGTGSNRTLLKTVNTAYMSYGADSYDIYPALLPTQVTTIWPTGQQYIVTHTYDTEMSYYLPLFIYNGAVTWDGNTGPYNGGSYGRLLSTTEYDYGSPGAALKTTATTYLPFGNSTYLNDNLIDYPSSVTVTGSGPGSITNYTYDQYSLVSSGISTQRDSTPADGTYRGNLTSVSRWLNTTNSYLPSTYTYFDTGMQNVAKDPNLNPTTYAYSSSYAGAFPTTVTNALNQTTTYTYDFNTGFLTSTTDPNGQMTTYVPDLMVRTNQITFPNGGQAAFCYTDTSSCVESGAYDSIVITEKINSSQNRISAIEVDGLGREIRRNMTNGEFVAYDQTDTCYDGLGHVSYKSYSYQSTGLSAARSCTVGGDIFAFDGLGRTTSVTHSDGSVISTSYTGNCATVTDEQLKTRESCTDGASRLTEVIESPTVLNFATSYTYDALDNLTGVTQTSLVQRSFLYDSLSRLTTSINPESNWAPATQTSVATTYLYDGDGNLISKTEPAQNQQSTSTVTLTYCYDPLNRMTAKGYTNQTCTNGEMPSPVATYSYDGTNCQGKSPCLNIGHRTGMSDAAGSETWFYTYDSPTPATGLKVTDQRTTNSVTRSAVYQDNYLGLPVYIQYPSGRIINYTYNTGARPTSATDTTTSINYASAVHYWANGAPCWAVYNGAITTAETFNGRSQPLGMQATGSVVTYPSSCNGLGQTGSLLDLTYCFTCGSGDNGNIMGITNNRDTTRSQTFWYDPLNRLLTAETTSTYSTSPAHCWGESYVYDNTSSGGRWGNLTNINGASTAYNGCTQESLSVTWTAQNRFGTSTYTYDTAGNLTSVTGGGTNAYDAENHLTSTAGVTYGYDGDGKRVEKATGGAVYKLYWYGLNDSALAETDGSGNITTEYIFLNGKRIAYRVGP